MVKLRNFVLLCAMLGGQWLTMDAVVRFTQNGLEYSKDNGSTVKKVSLEKVDPTLRDVVIPEAVYYDGKRLEVTYIESKAFKGNTTITSVTVPNTVVNILPNSFSGCTSLQRAIIGAQRVRESAFAGCSSLKEVEITNNASVWKGAVPQGVRVIGRHYEVEPFTQVRVSQLKDYIDLNRSNINLTGKPIVMFSTGVAGCIPAHLEQIELPMYLAKTGVKNAVTLEINIGEMTDSEKNWMKDFCARTNTSEKSVPCTWVILPDGRMYGVCGFSKSEWQTDGYKELKKWLYYCQ